MKDYRIGQGFDVHQLVTGRKLIICGADIPYEKGLLGHSDADVAVHALMDALLGALALPDIGEIFPDTDAEWKGADSMVLLRKVMALPEFEEWEIVNVDLTVVAQRPKLSPYKTIMRQNLAAALQTALEDIAVKATTTEKLGFTGRGEGIAATAVVLLHRR